MNRRIVWSLVWVSALASPIGHAQTLGKPAQKTGEAVKGQMADSSPVTTREMGAVFTKVRQIVGKIVLRKKIANSGVAASDKPASKSQIIAEMKSIFDLVRPEMKFSPKPLKYDASILAYPTTHPARKAVESLVAYGCVDKYGPLATGRQPGMTCEEFGDAVGYFLARIADLTHTPSAKFSPALMGG
jgi:hypothetical protein